MRRMVLRRRPLTRGQIVRSWLRYPWMTGQVVLAIYFEALRLWMKKCPYYPHPGNHASRGRSRRRFRTPVDHGRAARSTVRRTAVLGTAFCGGRLPCGWSRSRTGRIEIDDRRHAAHLRPLAVRRGLRPKSRSTTHVSIAIWHWGGAWAGPRRSSAATGTATIW